MYDFYIRPFVSGTFKLNFELQKFINNKLIGTPVKINVIFNAVKIKVGYILDGNHYSYYIIINDGNGKEDTYLNAQNMIQRCVVTYIKNGKELITNESRTILPGEKFEYTSELKDNSPDTHKFPIKKIRITQTTSDYSEFVIEYYNIKY